MSRDDVQWRLGMLHARLDGIEATMARMHRLLACIRTHYAGYHLTTRLEVAFPYASSLAQELARRFA